MNKNIIKGFLKEAAEAGLTVREGIALAKVGFANDQAITPTDMAHIRADMASSGANPAYGQNSPEATMRYRADLLNRRDDSVDTIPELSGAVKGVGHGLVGAAAGGLGGAAVGKYLKDTNLLNMDYKYKTHLPTGMGVSAAVLAGILTALPSAKREFERQKSIKKLNAPNNLADVLQGNQTEQALLNS